MQTLFTQHFTWLNLFATALTLAVVFLILKTGEQLLRRTVLPGRIRMPLQSGLRWALLFFEPAAALLLLVIFVFIRPELNGPVVALLLLGGFSHLRNYLSGFILRMYENVAIGNRLRTPGAEGVVKFIGRLGLQLRTDDGMHFSSYSKLLSDGFTLVTGEEAGGFFHLDISPKEIENNDKNFGDQLQDLLTQAPYISQKYRIDISEDLNHENHFSTKILVEEEHHLHELIALLDEQDWEVTIRQNLK